MFEEAKKYVSSLILLLPELSVGVSCKSFLTRKLSGMVIYYQLTKLNLIMCTFKRAIFEP